MIAHKKAGLAKNSGEARQLVLEVVPRVPTVCLGSGGNQTRSC
jgi:hypothetical protein